VRAAIAAGVPVVPIPGANAAVTALIASGLPSEEFHFLGFLPEKAGARRTFLEDLATAAQSAPRPSPRTLIFYEAPHRILETLADMEEIWGPLPHAVLARELTKLHEEFVRGTVAELRRELANRERIRGEITLLVEAPRAASPSASATGPEAAHQSIADRVARIGAETGCDEKEALKRLARELNRSKSDLYRELQRERARKR
jgi:16S rRNA (cytidine1402-2'-O)-methyltransferase